MLLLKLNANIKMVTIISNKTKYRILTNNSQTLEHLQLKSIYILLSTEYTGRYVIMADNYLAEKKTDQDILKIYTLGRFQVCYDGQKLFADTGRYQKIGDLFMYLITHRGKPSAPDVVMETLWPEREYSNPRNVLKNMVYRLKQNLEELGVPDARSFIIQTFGGYKWNSDARCWLDVDVFESLCKEASDLYETEPALAAEKYRQALYLYQGHYFPECQSSEWILSRRHYYRRLFVRSVTELLSYQKERGMYEQMAEDCEKVFSVEDFDETVHLFYMEALLEEGKASQARAHYEYITSLNYREHGAKPSPAIQHIYRLIKAQSEKNKLDLADLQELLQEKEDPQGALLCEPDTFRLFCRLERLRADRAGLPVHLGLLTLTGPELKVNGSPQLKECREQLRKILLSSIRKVDILSPWNENQYALLLPGLTEAQSEIIMQRVHRAFKSNVKTDKATLRYNLYPVTPVDEEK